MLKQTYGNLSATTQKSIVLKKDNAYKGYGIQVCGSNATGTVTIKVYESMGGVANDQPLNSNAFEWVEAATGTVTATDAFFLNREKFKGRFIYVLIDASAGSLDDSTLYYKQS